MESKRQISAAAITLLMVCLVGCSTPHVEQAQAPTKPIELGIAQVGFDKTARFVYCDFDACPRPTPKTPIVTIAPTKTYVSQWEKKNSPGSQVVASDVNVQFKFNSSAMSKSDINGLRTAALSISPDSTQVEIIARSDFVGPPRGQQKIAAARFNAMQKLIAKQAPGVRILEHQEIAAPTAVDSVLQSQQRRGTVRFIPSTTLSLKGDSK
jgi:hypothetical protein